MGQSKRRGIIKKAGIVLVILLIVIQFFHPAKNINPDASPQDIAALYPMPDHVHSILVKACYDCHSNNTRYPWYNNIQPVAWWLNNHITEGKRELNFSEFGKRAPDKQLKKIKKVTEAVQQGWMPLNSYTWIHKDAILTDAEKNALIDWASGIAAHISARNPSAQ